MLGPVPRKLASFYIDPEQALSMQRIKERDGVNLAEQVRRGIDLWLELKGEKRADRKRVAARKRS